MSTPHRNNLKERAAQGLVTHDNTGGYFVVECQGCSAVYPSFQCVGGGQIADTGDYDDARCPHCGQEAPEECDNVGLAWNTQQEQINALQERLNAADQKDDDQSFQLNDREGSRRDWFEVAQEAEKRVKVLEGLLCQSRGLLKVSAERLPRKHQTIREHIDHLRDGIEAALSASAEPGTKPCEHEWTDDGEFLLICTACGAQEDHNPGWRDMATAPRDGTMLRLLVEFEDHSTEDADHAPTIGANNFDNDEVDEWKFAGWCWTHDHFVEGKGIPVGWLPMLDSKSTEGASHE